MKLVMSFVLSTLIGFNIVHAQSYKVDPGHSSISFKVKHLMISNAKGNFEKFSGNFTIDEKTKLFSSINGTVNVSSVTTKDIKRDEHLKGQSFFDVNKYPTMNLKLLSHTKNEVTCELTIKNITKTVVLNIQELSQSIIDPWGNTRLAFELHGKINRQDFNINFNKVIEGGGLLVGDTVKFEILLEGVQIK